MGHYLDVAIEAAKKGGALALSYFEKDLEIRQKSNDTPVTEADERTEALMRGIILKAFPQHSFLGEESGSKEGNEYLWIVDPIDGTRHFVKGLPGWGTLVALLKEGELIANAVSLPTRDTILHAEKGKGAFVNGERCIIKEAPLDRATILHENLKCMVRESAGEALVTLAKQAYMVAGMPMRDGYTAFLQGKADATVTAGVNPWDVLPWALLGQEAGATVTDIHGKPLTRESTSLLMAAPKLHRELRPFF